jgi:hypothetical protein
MAHYVAEVGPALSRSSAYIICGTTKLVCRKVDGGPSSSRLSSLLDEQAPPIYESKEYRFRLKLRTIAGGGSGISTSSLAANSAMASPGRSTQLLRCTSSLTTIELLG